MTVEESVATIAGRFDRQADSAVMRSSPLYDALLRRCARDIEELGPTWRLLQDRAAEPSGDVLPLRLMASVHRLVLAGEAPDLAHFYPSTGGRGAREDAWPAFRSLLEERADDLRGLLDRPLQTNEVQRCTPVLVGLAWLFDRTGLPPTVLEIGASGGLNLNWHRFGYEGPDGRWGPADSPVTLSLPPGLTGLPSLHPAAESQGCDRAPLDVRDPEDRRWLRACVWADQTDRLALLDAALEVAEEHPPAVDSSDAAPWLGHRLAEPRPGSVTVVVQTIVHQYLSAQQADGVAAVIERAGQAATTEAPVAWLRMEPPPEPERLPPEAQGLAEVRVRLWPGGEDHLLAYTGFHGRPVQLLPGC